jgi:hypothetical protein
MDKAYGKWLKPYMPFILLYAITSALLGSDSHCRYRRSHTLRYVLRNKATGQVYLVILFTLYRKEDVDEDGFVKPHALEAAQKASGHVSNDGADSAKESFDEEKALEEARRKLSGVGVGDEGVETSADDVD